LTDVDAVVREFLASQTVLTNYTDDRIYASVDMPAGYTPEDGPAVLFGVRGGGQDYSSKVLEPSYQFRTYAKTERQAREVDRALYTALNDQKFGLVKSAVMETMAQLLAEPETGWPVMLTFYRLLVGNQ